MLPISCKEGNILTHGVLLLKIFKVSFKLGTTCGVQKAFPPLRRKPENIKKHFKQNFTKLGGLPKSHEVMKYLQKNCYRCDCLSTNALQRAASDTNVYMQELH